MVAPGIAASYAGLTKEISKQSDGNIDWTFKYQSETSDLWYACVVPNLVGLH
jgi:hypothetical protein